MDDRFMHQMRREPDPLFGRELRERLRTQETRRRFGSLRPAPVLAGAFAAALVVSLFTVPAVRVSAQALLDLFRVRTFAAVPFDATRLVKLRSLESNGTELVFDSVETLHESGPPVLYTSVAAASSAAGFAVQTPGFLPFGVASDSLFVRGEGAQRMTVSEPKLRAMLDALEIHDVMVPMGIDGKVVEVRMSPVVVQQFRTGAMHAMLIQARSPEMSVPAGLEVERLAEIGLRVLGLDAGEARRVAQTTDWRTTLVVPVPMNAGTFRQVTVRGQRGLLVTTVGTSGDGGRLRREGTTLMWTEGGLVFGLTGNLAGTDALQMAESLR